ncbi:hypothetical protein MIDIC_310015 [Alphaproteobacteria bacterium]
MLRSGTKVAELYQKAVIVAGKSCWKSASEKTNDIYIKLNTELRGISVSVGDIIVGRWGIEVSRVIKVINNIVKKR